VRQLSLLELAKEGDPDAIAALMNRVLQPRGVTAKAVLQDRQLHILLEAEQVPNQSTLVEYVCQGVMGLGVKSIEAVTIYGRRLGEVDPAWTRVIEMGSEVEVASSAVATMAPAAASAGLAGTGQQALSREDEFSSVAWQGNLAKVLLGSVVLLLVAFVGYAGVMRLSQRPKFERSQTLVAGAAEADDATDINALKASQQQLQEATKILEGIPKLPGSDRQKADEELAIIRPRLEAVETQLAKEQKALNNLEAAKRLGFEAAKLVQGTPQSAASWKQAQTKWDRAIGLLAAVPRGTFVSDQARERLAIYQRNYAVVSQRLTTTEKQQQKRQPNSVFTQDPADLNSQK